MRHGVTDEVMHALCGRLPALTYLYLYEVRSLTVDGLRAVGGLTTLTNLELSYANVTDAVLRELRGLTALTFLGLNGCSEVTDVGLQHLSSLAALADIYLHGMPFHGTSTTRAGRKALQASLPALRIRPRW